MCQILKKKNNCLKAYTSMVLKKHDTEQVCIIFAKDEFLDTYNYGFDQYNYWKEKFDIYRKEIFSYEK